MELARLIRPGVLLMVAAAMVIPLVEAALPKMSVRILNHLSGNLIAHCQSSVPVVDLGVQCVEAGKDYYFSFYVNTWGTTVCWCKFNFGNRWNSFDVWTGPGFSGPCQHCFWTVERDGFYRAEEESDTGTLQASPV